jgi:hypothetical protein
MNIHNLTCPGCHSPDHIENVINGEVWFHWKCNVCQTKILTEKETRKISTYYLVATYKDIIYEGMFVINSSIFRLDRYSPGKWTPVFKLSFLPEFDASNFAKKLPIILTFY